jgi:hypothetical protein
MKEGVLSERRRGVASPSPSSAQGSGIGAEQGCRPSREHGRGCVHYDGGEYTDTVEIAQRCGLSDPHVRRLLRFAYLAPDIVEAIIEGRQPRSLTVKLLLRRIPPAWSNQCTVFGFANSKSTRWSACLIRSED